MAKKKSKIITDYTIIRNLISKSKWGESYLITLYDHCIKKNHRVTLVGKTITFELKQPQQDSKTTIRLGQTLIIKVGIYPQYIRMSVNGNYEHTDIGRYKNVAYKIITKRHFTKFLKDIKVEPSTSEIIKETVKEVVDDIKIERKLPSDKWINYRGCLMYRPIKDILDKVIEKVKLNRKCSTGGLIDEVEIFSIGNLFIRFKPKDTKFLTYMLFELFKYIDTVYKGSSFVKEIILATVAEAIIKSKYSIIDPKQVLECELEATKKNLCYAHCLQFYGGKCQYLHGHNGKLTIKANLKNDTLTKRPMFISYGFLKGFLKHIDNRMDHKTLWSMNENETLMKVGDGFKISTSNQDITFKDHGSGLVIMPALPNVSQYSTSEVTLATYVIQQFYIFLMRFLVNDKGEDSTDMAMFDFYEPVKVSFRWWETDETVCTISINV